MLFAAALIGAGSCAHARAQTGAPAPLSPAPVTAPETGLDPGSPLAPLPDLGVDWPDLATPDAGTTPATSGATIDPSTTRHYAVTITGLDKTADDPERRGEPVSLKTRFDALSTLHKDRGDPANVAQIDRRARDDAQLLTDLLRSDGYYDAIVDPRIAPAGAQVAVTLAAQPGTLYRFETVTVTGLDAVGAEAKTLRESFAVKAGDAVDAAKVTVAEAALTVELGRRGFPFAKVAEPHIVVDHSTRKATLALTVTPAAQSRFGQIIVAGRKLFTANHVQHLARFHPGDGYDAAKLEDLRRALVATGLVSSVRLTPRPGETPGVVDILATIEPAPPRTVAAELGYGTGEGAQLQLSWQHRNLLPPEGAVTFSGTAGTREQALGALLRRSNFKRRDRVLTAQVAASHSNLNAYDAKSLLLSAGIERQTNIIWQKKWTWSLGGEFTASSERALPGADAIDTTRKTYLVGAIPLSLGYDGSDDLLNPSRGFRITGRFSPEASFLHGVDGYLRTQLDASAYQPVGARVVLAGRIRLGSIAGTGTDDIAPSRRFYSGGGGSVRGYGYQDIGPRGVDNDPIGGRSIAEFGSEVRVRFGNFGVVPFFDGGNIYRATLPRFPGLRYGAGMGVRYYTSFGPIRFDVGTPINRQKGEGRVAVYVSLGQAF